MSASIMAAVGPGRCRPVRVRVLRPAAPIAPRVVPFARRRQQRESNRSPGSCRLSVTDDVAVRPKAGAEAEATAVTENAGTARGCEPCSRRLPSEESRARGHAFRRRHDLHRPDHRGDRVAEHPVRTLAVARRIAMGGERLPACARGGFRARRSPRRRHRPAPDGLHRHRRIRRRFSTLRCDTERFGGPVVDHHLPRPPRGFRRHHGAGGARRGRGDLPGA